MSIADVPDVPVFWFDRPDGSNGAEGIHGVAHTRRVWIHAQEIAEELDLAESEREALHYAALWHDIGRTHDGADYYHGAKSAGKAVGLGLHDGMESWLLDTVLHAITHHSGGEEYEPADAEWLSDPEVGRRVFLVLKDADGLDRVRLGKRGLNVDYLRFEESKHRVPRAWELLKEIS